MRVRVRPTSWAGFLAAVAATLACAPAAGAQDSQTRIIRGSNVAIEDHPYQVLLKRSGDFICGGSILDPTTVVTAAHCVTVQGRNIQVTHRPYPASQFAIGYGSANQRNTIPVQVSSIAVPAAYQAPVASADESYDVAVLRLAAPIPVGPTAAPILLVSPDQSKSTDTAFATGWGATREGGAGSQTLQGVELALRDDAACTAKYPRDYVASRSVCAGGGSSLLNDNGDTCQGDSGGPLAVQVEGVWRLLGITSYGTGCGRANTPAVYTWTQGSGIESFISSRGADDRSILSSVPVAAPVATPPAPPAQAATRDTTRPTLRYSKFSCTRKRRCTVRLLAADNLGPVAKLSTKVSHRVKRCTRRNGRKRCRTVTRTKTLKPTRVTGGFSATATLVRGTYTLTAVGTDASGNRSTTLRRTLRVKG